MKESLLDMAGRVDACAGVIGSVVRRLGDDGDPESAARDLDYARGDLLGVARRLREVVERMPWLGL